MGYAAIALATLGLGLGLMSRVWALLPIVMLVFLGTVTFSVEQGSGLLEATLVVVFAQIIIQSCYFIGLVVRTTFGPPRQPAMKLSNKASMQAFADVRTPRLRRHVA